MSYLLNLQCLLLAYLKHGSDEFVAPAHANTINDHLNKNQTHPHTYLVSLNPPFLALVNGVRMAIVMTTSSGDFWNSAPHPEVELPSCPASCLRRSMCTQGFREK